MTDTLADKSHSVRFRYTHNFYHHPLYFHSIIVIFLTIVNNQTIPYDFLQNILERGKILIDYTPFWNTLKDSQETTYTLINRHHVSSATIDKLRKNKPMNTTTLNDLCRILDCNLENIAKYVPSEKDQLL